MSVKIREIDHEDLNFMLTIENNKSNWKYGINKSELSLEDALDYIKQSKLMILNNDNQRFVIEYNNTKAGLIDLYDYQFQKSFAKVGIIVLKKFRGKGVGDKSLKLLIEFCKNYLNINYLESEIEKSNQSSINLFENNNFMNISGNKYVYKTI
jgi:diamine N-acetyltransferase